jgi:hypothetical protein
MAPLQQALNDLTFQLLESPLKACAWCLTLTSLGYLTIKIVRKILVGNKDIHCYPPCPTREPLIGALRSFPADHFYHRFSEWAAQYGTLISMS